MKANHTCRTCNVELNDENWYPSRQKKGDHICKECISKYTRAWIKANPERAKEQWTRSNRKQGMRPHNENKECAMYLGCHIAERVLSYVFKDVTRMPYGNYGYDLICSHEKLIDVKSSTLHREKIWTFNIKRNTTADYFLCLAFDNREDLNPLHAWLILGSKLNHLMGTSISISTIHKWDEYRLDLTKILDCCNEIR